jgi:hypothetical protein
MEVEDHVLEILFTVHHIREALGPPMPRLARPVDTSVLIAAQHGS